MVLVAISPNSRPSEQAKRAAEEMRDEIGVAVRASCSICSQGR